MLYINVTDKFTSLVIPYRNSAGVCGTTGVMTVSNTLVECPRRSVRLTRVHCCNLNVSYVTSDLLALSKLSEWMREEYASLTPTPAVPSPEPYYFDGEMYHLMST